MMGRWEAWEITVFVFISVKLHCKIVQKNVTLIPKNLSNMVQFFHCCCLSTLESFSKEHSIVSWDSFFKMQVSLVTVAALLYRAHNQLTYDRLRWEPECWEAGCRAGEFPVTEWESKGADCDMLLEEPGLSGALRRRHFRWLRSKHMAGQTIENGVKGIG